MPQFKQFPKMSVKYQNSCNLTLYNTLRGHQNKIAKLCWSSDSSKILSASQDGFMIIWDAVTGFKNMLFN